MESMDSIPSVNKSTNTGMKRSRSSSPELWPMKIAKLDGESDMPMADEAETTAKMVVPPLMTHDDEYTVTTANDDFSYDSSDESELSEHDDEEFAGMTLESVRQALQNTKLTSDQELVIPPPADGSRKLIPYGKYRMAAKGTKDISLLKMKCKDTRTGKNKLLTHKTPEEDIDWSDIDDIRTLNHWRGQIYHRAGVKLKAVNSFHPDEEDWLELYYNVALVRGIQDPVKIPQLKDTCVAFNDFFEGSILKDRHGNDMPPRTTRQVSSFLSKANRVLKKLKETKENEKALSGPLDNMFEPFITPEMFRSFKQQKAKLLADLKKEENKGKKKAHGSMGVDLDGDTQETHDQKAASAWFKLYESFALQSEESGMTED